MLVSGNWAAVVKELRRVLGENVTFSSNEYLTHFNFENLETDSFHPFDDDAEYRMSRVLNSMPVRCDYRSCVSLHNWQDYRWQMEEAIVLWLEATEYLVRDYYGDSWNFFPGYRPPESIVFADWDQVSTKVFARVHRAALAK